MAVKTSSKTVFKRFAGDSVKYEDAKPGTIAQIQPKEQLQARGAKSADGTSMQAEEVISGSFENLVRCVAECGRDGGDDFTEGFGFEEGCDRKCDGELDHSQDAGADGGDVCGGRTQWRGRAVAAEAVVARRSRSGAGGDAAVARGVRQARTFRR